MKEFLFWYFASGEEIFNYVAVSEVLKNLFSCCKYDEEILLEISFKNFISLTLSSMPMKKNFLFPCPSKVISKRNFVISEYSVPKSMLYQDKQTLTLNNSGYGAGKGRGVSPYAIFSEQLQFPWFRLAVFTSRHLNGSVKSLQSNLWLDHR